ncbi:MAG: pyrimidine/purine nucleoside phosphorylase [Cyanobacteria bacterium P01_F01_bin.42]
MAQFDNVTVVKEVNAYFDGKVTSRTVLFADGSKKTLGVMLPGEYEFNTDQTELMEIMSGDLEIRLPDSSAWQSIQGGQSFEVPKSSTFQLKIKSITDYCCSYIG